MLLIGHTNVNSQRHSNLSASTTRVCTEFKEISVDIYTENRVLRGDSRFIKHDPVSTIEESLKSSEAVSVTSSKNTNVDFRINKTNRRIAFNYSNSTSSTNKFQVPTTTANTSIKNTETILQKGNSKQKLQGRTAVVDKKLKNLPWSLLDSVSRSSADTDRYIQKGMGCIMSRDIKRGAMVKGEQIVIDKCIRPESSKISTFDLQRTKIFYISSFSNRKHHCTTLPCENGGNREPNVTEIKQKNSAVSLETPDHNDCSIPSKLFECGGRLAVSKEQGPIRMETLPKSISASLSE